MRLIDADLFKEEMRELYARMGYGDNDIHFSLRDLENNINVQKTVFEDIDMLQIKQTLERILKHLEASEPNVSERRKD